MAIDAAIQVFRRDLARSFRQRSQLAQPLLFFVLVVNLFPIAIGPDPALLSRLGPAIVWVAVLLASTLSLEGVFRYDYEDGSLEQLVLSRHPLPLLVGAKLLAHWLTGAAPLILLSLPVAALLGVSPPARLALLGALLLGTPVLSLVGATASALTVGLRGGALLLALLILPLYIPVLIFGASATGNAALELSCAAELYFLAGLAVLAATLTPYATAAALRIRLG